MLDRFFSRFRKPRFDTELAPRAPVAAPPPAAPTPPEDVVLGYHQITKHGYHRSARSLGYLDWDTQPDPFRRFAGADLVRLPFLTDDPTPPYGALYEPHPVAPRPVDLASVAQLLEISLSLTAWKELQGSRWSLRANPSSGNLHPTEGYVVIGPDAEGHRTLDVADDACVFHYAPAEHGLEVRGRFDAAVWRALMSGFPAGSFLVGLTSIHWREAWKYGERAYRYCHHDAGHAWGGLRLAAAAAGWRVVALENLGDAEVARLLGVDRIDELLDGERDEADGLAVVIPALASATSVPLELPEEAIEQVGRSRWFGRANPLSPEHVDWQVIERAAGAARKPHTAAPPRVLQDLAPDESPLVRETPEPSARTIFVQRRSAVDLDGTTRLPAAAFYRMLQRVLPAPRADGWIAPPWDTFGHAPRIHLGLFVHRVDDLVPGLYALPRRADALELLRGAMRPAFAWQQPPGCPGALPLHLLKEGDCRMLAKSVSCGQDIAGDGAFSLGMIGELEETVRSVGPWAYRRLHWEAGMIGQVLYLEAEAAGIRATGIGCFFDDAVHDAFGLAGTRLHTLYHFTMGGPIEDTRLTILPAYPDERRAQQPGLVEAA